MTPSRRDIKHALASQVSLIGWVCRVRECRCDKRRTTRVLNPPYHESPPGGQGRGGEVVAEADGARPTAPLAPWPGLGPFLFRRRPVKPQLFEKGLEVHATTNPARSRVRKCTLLTPGDVLWSRAEPPLSARDGVSAPAPRQHTTVHLTRHLSGGPQGVRRSVKNARIYK